MSTKKDKKAVKGAVVGVCVPARDMVHTGFAFDFARMVGHDVKHRCNDENNGDAPTRIFLALPTDCAIVFLPPIFQYIYIYVKILN